MKARKKNKKRIVILCIVIFAAAFFVGKPLYDAYFPSFAHADRLKMFGLSPAHPDEAAVLLGDKLSGLKARVVDGQAYLAIADVQTLESDRFYASAEDRVLLFTNADQIVRAESGQSSYTLHAEQFGSASPAPQTVKTDCPPLRIIDGTPFVSLEFMQDFSTASYELYPDPWRVRIETEKRSVSEASLLKSDTLRNDASIKGAIVEALPSGETLTVLKKGADWTSVATKDGLFGYVQTARLSAPSKREIAPVSQYVDPPYTDLVSDNKICLVWDQILSQANNANILQLLDDGGATPVDVVSPTWFSVADSSGALKGLASKAYVDALHARGIKVWALVSDFTSGLDRHTLLSREGNRRAFITGMIAASEEYGFDGINLDFENVPQDDGAQFSQLLRELSVACRQAGLVFSVDNYVPRAHTEHYNRTLQGEIADYVVIMGYDEHYGPAAGAGSVASIGFVEDGIQRTLKEAPARKTINAVPLYTRIWQTAPDGSLTATAVGQQSQNDWIAQRRLTPTWDETTGQNYVEYHHGGYTWQIWLEDAASQQQRVDVMKKYGLGGIAAWRLGFETPDIWPVIAGYTNPRAEIAPLG
ncbi:MAG: glycosyl hydrolase family 18 protein [Clostridiales bacterium]|nr:glycosyl hydrolase family 18 protein [Clostridiales bacterium]